MSASVAADRLNGDAGTYLQDVFEAVQTLVGDQAQIGRPAVLHAPAQDRVMTVISYTSRQRSGEVGYEHRGLDAEDVAFRLALQIEEALS